MTSIVAPDTRTRAENWWIIVRWVLLLEGRGVERHEERPAGSRVLTVAELAELAGMSRTAEVRAALVRAFAS